jgi:hypothetical protein
MNAGDPGLRNLARADCASFITVVAGLPRSGTSMLMKMLADGGLPAVTDGVRRADIDNPHGYFEDERTKRLRDDVYWLGEARGKVVKIVAPLLPLVPLDYHYRVILIERNLDEVLASQQTMLDRQGRKGAAPGDDHLRSAFRAQLQTVKAWLVRHANVRTLFVWYSDILNDPAAAATSIDEFLGGGLDTTAMALAIDRTLYRHRR